MNQLCTGILLFYFFEYLLSDQLYLYSVSSLSELERLQMNLELYCARQNILLTQSISNPTALIKSELIYCHRSTIPIFKVAVE